MSDISKEILLFLSTGTVAVIIMAIFTIVKAVSPLVMRNTQDTLKDVVSELKEVVEEMKKITHKSYYLEKELEKNLLETEHNKNNITSIFERLRKLEEQEAKK